MKTLYMFPGQGSQFSGMLKAIPTSFLDKCKKMTGIELVDTDESYQDTVQIQLALFLSQVYTSQQLELAGHKPDFVSGHSIGAFAAAVCAGVISFEEGLILVAHRSKWMKNAFPSGYGMGVVVGLTKKELSKIVEGISTKENQVYVSNENSVVQLGISGKIEGIEKVLDIVRNNGASVAKLLNVPVPSHCVLMTEVSEKLEELCRDLTFQNPKYGYLSNFSGRLVWKKEQVVYDLINNVRYPVKWDEMMSVANEMDMNLAIELPVGKTLSNLLKPKISESCHIINMGQHGISGTEFLIKKWSV